MSEVMENIRNGIIVSCQAEGDDPFNNPASLAAFARAAEMGGAQGIRAQGAENIRAIRSAVKLPVIGIIKGLYSDGWVLITPELRDVDAIINAGADIVAVDVTARVRPNGLDGFQFLEKVRDRVKIIIMADISTAADGIRAADLGADIVATTLSGYTAETESNAKDYPDYELIEELAAAVHVPVIAEGRVWTPDDAKEAFDCGAFAVVVGTAITRPRVITQRFVASTKRR